MKSKTSCFNKCIYKKNMTHFWPIWLGILVYQILVLPFAVYVSGITYNKMEGLSAKEKEIQKLNALLSSVDIYINPVIIIIIAVVVALAVFSYLYTSKSANMIHAMPVTRKELYITNYFTGLTWLIVPQIIAFVSAVMVAAAYEFSGLIYILQGFGLAVGLSFFFFSMCTFTAMFTGHLLGIPFFVVVLNFLYVGVKSILTGLVGMISYGMTGTYEASKFDVLSPLYYLMQNLRIVYNYPETNTGAVSQPVGIDGVGIIAGYCAVAVIFAVAGYFIYRNRKLETAGNLISISCIEPLFRWGFTTCAAGLGALLFYAILEYRISSSVFIVIILFVILSVIFFFMAQMLLEKSFYVFKKKRMIELCVYSAVMVLFFIGIYANLFGQETRIPKVENVKEAYVSVAYTDGGSQKEEIEKVIAIHQQMIDSKKVFREYSEGLDLQNRNVINVNIKYYMNNGSAYRRNYYIPADEKELKNKDSMYNQLMDTMGTKENYLKNTFGVNYENTTMQGGSLDIYRGDDNFSSRNFSTEDAQEIYQSILKDLDEGNMDKIIKGSYVSFEDDAYKKETYSNTIYLDYFCSDGIVQLSQKLYNNYNRRYPYDNYEYSKTGGAGISFNKDCTNIIDTLIKLEVIKGTEELLTVEEKEEMDIQVTETTR